jgi:two-component system response regulator
MPVVFSSGLDAVDFHILLVDDDANEGDLLATALLGTRSRVTVDVINTPEKAIRFLYKDSEFADKPTPDLILLDYRMPSNGGRVLSILKGDPNLRGIPVVAMSRDASAEDIAEIYDRNANCCINKPIDGSDLTQDLRGALTQVRQY